ncbi:MAG: AIR synthase family protein [Pyrobaculum sp.]
MRVGKLPPRLLEQYVFGRRGASRPEVIVGPSIGEDAAVVDLGGKYLAVHTDPISGSVRLIGRLAVYVPTNDIAVRGVEPAWLSVALFLPPTASENDLDEITRQIDEAARELGVMVVGGHTEVTTAVTRPLVVATAAGVGPRYVTTGGARPGDYVIMTKSAGQEAASILATDFEQEALARGVEPSALEKAKSFIGQISVVREALALADLATAMHDPTEGGLAAALAEVAYASGVTIQVDREAVIVYREVEELCRAFGIDPLETLSSGVLLATVPPHALDDTLNRLKDLGIPHAVIGRVVERRDYLVDVSGRRIYEPYVEDKLFTLF